MGVAILSLAMLTLPVSKDQSAATDCFRMARTRLATWLDRRLWADFVDDGRIVARGGKPSFASQACMSAVRFSLPREGQGWSKVTLRDGKDAREACRPRITNPNFACLFRLPRSPIAYFLRCSISDWRAICATAFQQAEIEGARFEYFELGPFSDPLSVSRNQSPCRDPQAKPGCGRLRP